MVRIARGDFRSCRDFAPGQGAAVCPWQTRVRPSPYFFSLCMTGRLPRLGNSLRAARAMGTVADLGIN